MKDCKLHKNGQYYFFNVLEKIGEAPIIEGRVPANEISEEELRQILSISKDKLEVEKRIESRNVNLFWG